MATEFGIKDGYKENPVEYFVDNLKETRGIVFQPDVYTFAEYLAESQEAIASEHGERMCIADVGCGQADKLAAIHERHPKWEYYGVDYGGNLDHCREVYDWGTWIDADLETIDYLAFPDAVIICSDVIEHLLDPTPLLRSLKESQAFAVVLSTPERDLQHGLDHMGPSPNINHVREWNTTELHDFLEGEGFKIRFHGLTRSSDQGPYMQTQLVVM